MSIWGDMDVDDIPDDPFHIPANTYRCICTEAYTKIKDDQEALIIKWTIQEPDSDYHEDSLTEFFPLFKKPIDELTGKERKRTAFMAKRLREAFDLTKEELKEWKPSNGIGMYAYLTVVNNSDKNDETKTYNNVSNALCQRLYDEKTEQGASQDISDFDI